MLPDLKNAGGDPSFHALAALAALGANGDLLVSLVHRGGGRPLRVSIQLNGFPSADKAQLQTLAEPAPWAANTLKEPGAVQLASSEIEVRDGSMTLLLEPYSLVQARFVPRP